MFVNKYFEFGYERKFYNVNHTVQIKQHNLELYKGYYFTLDVYEGGVKLMADISNRIVRMDNLWQYMNNQLGKSIRNKNALDNFFSTRVTTMARYGNHAKYGVIGYDLSLTPMSKFPNKDYNNYKDYFV
jgi:hypothetical protein